MLIDTHAHVNFQPFLADAEAVLERALAQDVFVNNVGTQWESSQRSIILAEHFPKGVWASIGLHPIHLFRDVVEQQTIAGQVQTIRTRAEQFDYQRYRALARSSTKVVAIGECGLDYLHFERAQLQSQRAQLIQQQVATLEQHIQLARELDLPVIVHCRDAEVHTDNDTQAFEDLLDLLRRQPAGVRGVIHCYTGPSQFIPDFLELGWYIGFTGIITFPKATDVQQAMLRVPLERLLLETDAPYLTPIPHRGQRNEPANVRFVAEQIAQLRNLTPEQVAQQTTANAVELFRLSW